MSVFSMFLECAVLYLAEYPKYVDVKIRKKSLES